MRQMRLPVLALYWSMRISPVVGECNTRKSIGSVKLPLAEQPLRVPATAPR